MEEFVACFSGVAGPRQDNIRHDLFEVKDNGPENIGLLRRLALNLARLEGSKGSIKGKLKRAGWNDAFLTRLLTYNLQFGKSHMR